ncbi:hypothetical protein CC1G_04035 [Coprinopsis cinerea okayama7|uniref:Mis12 domain-containing protein n=1 Tax=Coprinopsis cinerea (strain Okayama-7 / 130 / ATCC MYA-4618 / FGSC 9003) TaxID=240176 RepID=A8N8I8_COPC7|nr:hypothetical protein CC1G_04035 [Coprinopsis cinerea okayama7\|eukprot:XP_001831144.1 hypothetical protein CC1G_04035 [Coprinopsis cinerea okayama7\
MAAADPKESSATTHLPSSLLLCEALGFAPQLLLDDIINIANNAVQDGVNGMEEFLLKWVEERKTKVIQPPEPPPPAKGKKGKKAVKAPEKQAEDLTQEVEQGLVAFQTLLEYHTDIAFDFFEAWSLRNIFFIAPELEQGNVVVLPHYEGADLTGGKGGTELVEREREMMEEIEELRKQLDEQRRLTRLLKRGLSSSKAAKRRAEKRFSEIAALLGSESLANLSILPESLNHLYHTVASLPPPDASMPYAEGPSSQDGASSLAFGSGKRQWEIGTTGYVNWAVNRIVSGRRQSIGAGTEDPKDGQAKKDSGANLHATYVDKLEAVTAYVGSSNDMRGAVETLEKGASAGNTSEGDMELD